MPQKADLLQAKLQGQKDEHEALTALQNAVRTLSTLERQLFQAGIDPELLVRATRKRPSWSPRFLKTGSA